MRTMNPKGRTLALALLTSLMFVVGFVGSVFAHPSVPLRDYNDDLIPAGSGLQAAYSAQTTCGGCHHYDEIEQHSYHAQLGANQWMGWNLFNPDSPNTYKNGVAAKGKNWVQSPGHVGKW